MTDDEQVPTLREFLDGLRAAPAPVSRAGVEPTHVIHDELAVSPTFGLPVVAHPDAPAGTINIATAAHVRAAWNAMTDELHGRKGGKTIRAARALAYCAIEGLDVTVATPRDPDGASNAGHLLELAAREVERICAERGIEPHDALQRLGTSAD